MLNQKKVEIFLAKFHKSLAKQFLEVALIFDYKNNKCRNCRFFFVFLHIKILHSNTIILLLCRLLLGLKEFKIKTLYYAYIVQKGVE